MRVIEEFCSNVMEKIIQKLSLSELEIAKADGKVVDFNKRHKKKRKSES